MRCVLYKNLCCLHLLSCAVNFIHPTDIMDPFEFNRFKTRELVELNYYAYTLLLNYDRERKPCESYVNPTANRKHPCFAVVKAEVDESFRRLRFDGNPKLGSRMKSRWGNMRVPTGLFREVSKSKGRERLNERLGQFLSNFESIELNVKNVLMNRGFTLGENIVVMVVNEGEIDLFYNYACSMQTHNMTLEKVLVFAASGSIVPVIEATGATAVYDENFAPVAKDASIGYLDRVFVDMMWYKAFSVYMILRAGFNVLFQDVDLVWFKDPFPYFERYLEESVQFSATGERTNGFFSDDGQRGLRYSPFFANSGFFYLLTSQKSINLAWSILTAFDTLVTSGSHQNVLTMRLQEGLWLTNFRSKLLPLQKFPTGIQFHHNPAYMTDMKRGIEQPYNFHMCWTQTKDDKLENFKSVNMWYLKPQCNEKDMRKPGGKFKKYFKSVRKQDSANMIENNELRIWSARVQNMCCLEPDLEKLWTIPSNRKKGPSYITI